MATRMSTPTTTAQKQSDPKVDEEVTKKTKQEEVLDRQEDLFWQIKKQIWSEKVQSFRSGPFMKLAMFCLCSLLMILSMKNP